ncbi:hypothetical protein [Streptomyces sp. NPDC054784]
MTPTPTPTKTRVRGPRRRGARDLVCLLTVLSCLPYLTLKAVWICGGEVGIPAGSVLLDPDHAAVLRAANALTLLMDAAVIALALLFTRPWGRRAPVWLPVLPAWLATGLLAPIVVGLPLTLGLDAAGAGGAAGEQAAEDGRFLADWVFGLVYGGFTVQALALGALFVPYVRERWGHLWRGRTGDLRHGATGPALRAAALGALLLSVLPLTTNALWAGGATVGLSAGAAADADAGLYARSAGNVLFLLAAVGGLLTLARPRGRRGGGAGGSTDRAGGTAGGGGARLAVPLGLAWTGSGATACWGGWMMLGALAVGEAAERPTPLMSLTYAVQMTVGLVVVTAGAHLLAERAARSPEPFSASARAEGVPHGAGGGVRRTG